jgi:hypothetical protein
VEGRDKASNKKEGMEKKIKSYGKYEAKNKENKKKQENNIKGKDN